MKPASVDDEWPAEDLEAAPCCEVCGSARRVVWLRGLRDRIFRTAPGEWTLWRCADCGLVQLDPRPTPASIGRAYAAYYTHQAAEKNLLVQGDLPDQQRRRAMNLSYVNRSFGHRLEGASALGWLAIASSRRRRAWAGQAIRHLPGPAQGTTLIDVGCGSGGFLRVARTLGCRASGIEFDPSAAALAQALGFEVQVASIGDAEVAAASIDHITLNHVIEHLYDPVAAMSRMRGWLRPGGRIWLQTPNTDGAGAARYGVDWRGLEPPRHLVLFNPRSLRLALERAGFERIALMPPPADSAFYIAQSEGIRAEHNPYLPDRPLRRAARWEGREWDRAAMARPERAESVTMVGYRPG